ncbi:MAG: hypothetical protein ACLSEF_02030 [Faecalibacterium prausnitzii]
MLSYRKLAMCVLGRPLHTGGGGIDLPRPASQRAAAFILTAAMLTTLAAPAFAKTWHIEDGDITVKAGETKGTNKVSQGANQEVEDTDTIITNRETKASSNTVTIEAEKKDDKVEVTLKDVNIDTSSRNKAAVSVTGEGDTNIKLNGDNALKSDIYRSGIYGRGSLTISGGENDSLTAQGGSGADGIYSSGSLTISGGTVTANGDDGGRGIYSRGGVTISGGTVEAAGGSSGSSNGGSGIYSNDIDLSGSLELTAKAGSPNGKALSQKGSELVLDTIKDKLGPGAKVTATDADGKVIDQVPIPRPVEPEGPVIPEESSSSSDGGSAAPSAPASPLPGLTVTDKDGQRISYTSIRGNNVLSIRAGRFTASLRVSLAALRQLRAEGIDTITFRTVLCSTTLSVDELLAIGGEDAEVVLTHHTRSSTLTVGGKAV